MQTIPAGRTSKCTGSCGEQAAIPQCDSRSDERIGRDPDIISNVNRAADDGHVLSLIIMRARDDVRVLADASVIAQRDNPHAIDDHLVADDHIAADPQIPGEFDANASINDGCAAHLRAEKSKKHDAPAVEGIWAPGEERAADDGPEESGDALGAALWKNIRFEGGGTSVSGRLARTRSSIRLLIGGHAP